MHLAGVIPSALAAAIKDVVLKGTGAETVRFLRSILLTVAVVASFTALNALSASSLSKKRAVECAHSKTSALSSIVLSVGPVSFDLSTIAFITQKSCGIKASRSRSLATISASVGV